MTLSVEILHLAVNKKQATQTLITYAQAFATSIKQSIKSVTKWSVHYFTSRERWYPLPESTVPLNALKFPKRKCKPSEVGLNFDQKCEMREWTSANGEAVCQRSCRQETTIARARTLPENAYFEELTPVSQHRNNGGDEVEEEINAENTESKEQEDEIPAYESESDAGVSSDDEDVIATVNNISNVATFLVGNSSRYGISITFNKR